MASFPGSLSKLNMTTPFIVMTAVFLLSCFQDFSSASAGLTPLMSASHLGYTERVEKLLASNPTQEHVVKADKDGFTALMHASSRHAPVVKLLLTRMDKKHLMARSKRGKTALIIATIAGNTAIIDLLLEKNHDEEHLVAEDNLGYSALMYAMRYQYSAVFQMLWRHHFQAQLQATAFIQPRDRSNKNAIQCQEPEPSQANKVDLSKLPLKALQAVRKQVFSVAEDLLNEDASFSKLLRTKIITFYLRLSKLLRQKMKLPSLFKLRTAKKPTMKWLKKISRAPSAFISTPPFRSSSLLSTHLLSSDSE